MRWSLARREQQLLDISGQLTEIASMQAGPAEKRAQLERVLLCCRQALAEDLGGGMITERAAERVQVTGAAAVGVEATKPAGDAKAPFAEEDALVGSVEAIEAIEAADETPCLADTREFPEAPARFARTAESTVDVAPEEAVTVATAMEAPGAALEHENCKPGVAAETWGDAASSGGAGAKETPATGTDPPWEVPRAMEAWEATESGEARRDAVAVPGHTAQGVDLAAEAEDSPDAGQFWKVVGGCHVGGIIVREGRALSSRIIERLQTGALVRELQLDGERLHFTLIMGDGPESGWVSTRLKDRELLVRTQGPRPLEKPKLKGSERLILWPRRGHCKLPPLAHHFRKVCVFGPFNSGTNAIMREIPRFFDAEIMNRHRRNNPALWKHTIFSRPAPLPADTFCICLVRDPGYWIQSLGRDPAAGTFNDFVPVRLFSTVDGTVEERPVQTKEARQLFERIFLDGQTYNDALEVWEQTVSAYFNDKYLPSGQVVVLRYEDYIFHFEKTIHSLAQRGLRLRDRPPPISPIEETAKDSTHPQAARRSLATTKGDCSNAAKRYEGRTKEQLERLKRIDPKLIHALGYGEDAVSAWVQWMRE